MADGQEDIQTSKEKKVQALFDKEILGMEATTPIGKMLRDLANKEKEFDRAAEELCMLATVKDLTKHKCTYCNAVGHKRSECPVHVRLRSKFRGDREINTARGKKSSATIRVARKSPKAIRKNKF